MNVLVATSRTQGQRSNDFCWTTDGELVWAGTECSIGHADDHCGCHRAMAGFDSHKSTTTVEVADLPLTRELVAEQLLAALNDSGFGSFAADVVTDEVDLVLDEAARHAPGTVLEYRDRVFSVRKEN